MNTYINEQKKECIITLTETKTVDEWKIIDFKYLRKALDALKALGKISARYMLRMFILIWTQSIITVFLKQQ